MKDFKCILTEIKSGNKNAFIELVEQFSPLITKYSHLLYKDEFEDMKSELTVALWQAVCNIKKYDINKQIIKYLSNALRIRFLELYRNSRSYNDNSLIVENYDFFQNIPDPLPYSDCLITQLDINAYINSLNTNIRVIAHYIINLQYTDSEIAKQLHISRQYTNRIRRKIREDYINTLNHEQ